MERLKKNENMNTLNVKESNSSLVADSPWPNDFWSIADESDLQSEDLRRALLDQTIGGIFIDCAKRCPDDIISILGLARAARKLIHGTDPRLQYSIVVGNLNAAPLITGDEAAHLRLGLEVESLEMRTAQDDLHSFNDRRRQRRNRYGPLV